MEGTALSKAELNSIETEREFGRNISDLQIMVDSLAIKTQVDYEYAAELTKQVKRMAKKVDDYWEPMRVSAKATYDGVLAKKNEMAKPLKAAEVTLKNKMSYFTVEQAKEAKRREEEARRLAEEEAARKLAEAVAAESRGDDISADIAMAEAEIMENASKTISVAAVKPVASGVSQSKSWKITRVDGSKVPVDMMGYELRPVDEKAVMRLIKATKGTIKIPGIEYEETVSISVRA